MIKKSLEVGERMLSIEMGRVARQADGAALIQYGDTVVLATACAQKEPREGIDFLPLTVDYREWTYAAGKIPGGFFKREGRPNQKEVLTSRLIDRPVRPLFPDGYSCETQVIGLVLSSDQTNDSDVLAVCGAGAALYCSSVPFPAPLAAVRIGLVDGRLVVNPTFQQLDTSQLDIVVAGTPSAVVMVEAGATEMSEDTILEAIALGHAQVQRICALIQEFHDEIRPAKRPVTRPEMPADILRLVEEKGLGPLGEAMRLPGKLNSYARVDEVRDSLLDAVPEEDAGRRGLAARAFRELEHRILSECVLKEGRRLDGRRFDEIRSIRCEVGVLPRTHGSALFTRGETQALVTATLGTSADAQRLDYIEGESEKRFMLHYNFPPFSVGEVKFLRGPGRREIGHGALAERSIEPMIPKQEDFPYTLRVVSDILESNGSSSMATVCGASLALMDAGVQVRQAVAGIAMGLIKAQDRFVILSDIAGAEDHHGDMDFKVAGTRDGITALQMDIKIEGVTPAIMKQALEQARQGRLRILDIMGAAIGAPRPDISRYAPRIITVMIPKDKIRDVIGTGGKVIRSIIERTGCKIEVGDDGRVDIASVDEASALRAKEIILELTAEAEIGKTYLGKVRRITGFGAFVEILPSVEGLLHVSEMAHHRVNQVEDLLKDGDEVMVKVISMDGQGRIRLSRKALLEETPEERQARESREARAGGPRGEGVEGQEHRGGEGHGSRGRPEHRSHGHRRGPGGGPGPGGGGHGGERRERRGH